MIRLTIPGFEGLLAHSKKVLDDRVKLRTEQVANNVWMGVIGGQAGEDFPYWSGGYVASWIFAEGVAAPNFYEPSLLEQPSHYPVPAPHWQILYKTYTWVTISNANPYAAHIEYVGSPSQPGQPWRVAFNAYANAAKGLNWV